MEAKEAKDIIDRAKNENEKVAILLLTEFSGKVAITAGVKGVEFKLGANAWVKQVAEILQGAMVGVEMTLPPLEVENHRIPTKSKKLDVAKRIARESLG